MPHSASDPFWQGRRSKQAVPAAVTIDRGAIRAGVFVFTGYYLGPKVGLNNNVAGGGVGGAILMAILGLLKSTMAKKN